MNALLPLLGIFVGAFITLLIQMYDRKDKFRLVAIEKRLSIHQKAFSLWMDLALSIHNTPEERENILADCLKFIKNNNLYLNQASNQAFGKTITEVHLYHLKNKSNIQNNISENDLFAKIIKINAGQIIAKGIGLPHLEANKIIKETIKK
ncbi:MAG: hypothetical protein ACYC49_09365 [Ignavibacteriaceae bacterium]